MKSIVFLLGPLLSAAVLCIFGWTGVVAVAVVAASTLVLSTRAPATASTHGRDSMGRSGGPATTISGSL